MAQKKDKITRLEELEDYLKVLRKKTDNDYDKLQFCYGGETFDLSDCNRDEVLVNLCNNIQDRIYVLKNEIRNLLYPI